jgi:VanZ family protein
MGRLFGRYGSFLLLVLLVCGCGDQTRKAADGTDLAPIPPNEVAAALVTLSDQLQSQVAGTAAMLEKEQPGNEVRKRALRWRIRAFEICQRARSRENAMSGLIEIWYWAAAFTRHLTDGTGKDQYGAQQAVVVTRAQKMEATVERMVRRVVPPERFAALQQQVTQALAQGDGFLAGDAPLSNPISSLLEATHLESLLSLPLAPFDAFSGVKAGGDAVARLAVTADRAVDLLAEYPKILDLHIQSAVLDIQAQDATRTMLAELQRANASVEAAIALVRALPAQLRAEAVALLEQSRPAQADVRETLRALTDAANALERLNAGVDQLVARAAPAKAGTAPDAPAKAPARPFDIREYTEALKAATATANDLRQTLGATETLLASPLVPTRIDEANRTFRGMIATIATWLIALLVTITACSVAIVFARRRAARP